MTVEVHHSGKSMEQRIADRLKNSGDPRADHHKQMGDGPTRCHTNIVNAGHVVLPGTAAHESDAQHQRFHDEASTQQETKSYFTGHKRGGDDYDD